MKYIWVMYIAWSAFLMVKASCISSPIQPTIFARVIWLIIILNLRSFSLNWTWVYMEISSPFQKMVISEKKKKRIKLLLQSAYLHSNNLPFTQQSQSCTYISVMCDLYRWTWLFYWPDRHCITMCSRTYVSSSILGLSKGKC